MDYVDREKYEEVKEEEQVDVERFEEALEDEDLVRVWGNDPEAVSYFMF